MRADHPYAKVSGGNYITFNTKLADALTSVTKIDEQHRRVHLKEPLAPFTGILSHQSLAILSAEYADQFLKAGTPEQLDRQPIGTGPFQFNVYQTNAPYVSRPSTTPGARGRKMVDRTPKVDDLIMPISTDAAVRVQRAQAGECHIANAPSPTDREAIKSSAKLNLVETPVASSGFIAFNFKDKPLQDRRVRQALADAINMKSLVDIVFDGTGGDHGRSDPGLALGSRPEPEGPSLRSRKGESPSCGSRLPQRLRDAALGAARDTPLHAQRPPRGRAHPGRLGQDRREGGDRELRMGRVRQAGTPGRGQDGDVRRHLGFPGSEPDPEQLFHLQREGKPSPSNIGSWCNARFNDLILRAGQITDQAQRADLYRQAQVVFNEEVPAILFGSSSALLAVTKSV